MNLKNSLNQKPKATTKTNSLKKNRVASQSPKKTSLKKKVATSALKQTTLQKNKVVSTMPKNSTLSNQGSAAVLKPTSIFERFWLFLKSIFLFFLAILRSLKNHIFQLTILILFIFVGSAVFNSSQEVNARLNDSHQKLMAKANEQSTIVSMDDTYFKSASTLQDDKDPVNYLDGIRQGLTKKGYKDAQVQYVDSRNFSVNNFHDEQKNNVVFKVLPWSAPASGATTGKNYYDINRPYIVQGDMPKSRYEIAISSDFAKKQGIKLYDTLNITNVNFLVTGLVLAPDYVFPALTKTTFPSNRTNCILYADYGAVFPTDSLPPIFAPYNNFDREIYISIKIPGVSNQRSTSIVKDVLNTGTYKTEVDSKTEPLKSVFNGDTNSNNQTFDPSSTSYTYNQRTNFFYTILTANQIVNYAFVSFTLFIVIILITIIIWKLINNERRLIGIFKALGYSKRQLMFTYLSYPLVISVIAVTLGWLLSFSLQNTYMSLFYLFFALPQTGLHFNLVPLIINMAFTMFILVTLTMISTYVILKTHPTELLHS